MITVSVLPKYFLALVPDTEEGTEQLFAGNVNILLSLIKDTPKFHPNKNVFTTRWSCLRLRGIYTTAWEALLHVPGMPDKIKIPPKPCQRLRSGDQVVHPTLHVPTQAHTDAARSLCKNIAE